MQKRFSKFIITFIIVLYCLVPFLFCAEEYNLTILLTNDLQSQVQPFVVTPTQSRGGYARLATLISTVREKKDNVLLFNSGDAFLGTFFSYFKGIPEITVMNKLGYDAMAIGNHEFDMGPTVLARIIDHAEFPVLSANISKEGPSSLKESSLLPYTIKDFPGFNVAILGITTPEIKVLSYTGGNITLSPPDGEMVKNIITTLRKKADLVIALTHIGTTLDRKLAQEVQGIDIICGGHSHDAFQRPLIIPHDNGRKTIIIQTGEHGEYLGKLDVTFVKDNEKVILKSTVWNLIPITPDIPPDKEINAYINSYIGKLPKDRKVGSTTLPLDTREIIVRRQESAVGDLFADAVREQYHTDIAFVNGGGIRGNRIYPAGAITTSMITEMHSFNNTIVLMTLTGSQIKEVLEHSVSMLPERSGRFIQVSGLSLTVNPSMAPQHVDLDTGTITNPGERITTVTVNGSPLEPEKEYRIAVLDFLAEGGDGFVTFKKGKQILKTQEPLTRIVTEFIKNHSPITPKTNGRIVIKKAPGS